MVCLAWVLAVMVIPAAHARPVAAKDLTELSIEDLMSVEVTTVSRKAQRLGDSAAAVFVITNEDIRRSGVTSIAEALRMVPGVEVARISSNSWAVTARGFNGQFANKLLVLMDGRSVYSPIYSGVYWDVQDTLLEDVDRIEVIRGPGASLWGANAVNGVINIITRKAADTQGGVVTGGFGNEERGFGALRYGGRIGDTAHYRAYGKYFNRDNSQNLQGGQAHDGWDIARGGGRIDWQMSDRDELTVQGDLYDGEVGNEGTSFSLSPALSHTDHRSFPGLRWQPHGAVGSGGSLHPPIWRFRSTMIEPKGRTISLARRGIPLTWTSSTGSAWGAVRSCCGDLAIA